MDSQNHIIEKSFKELNNYIQELEKYALLGMMGEVLSHGFNSGISSLNNQINNLPKDYLHLKETYIKTMGLVNGLTKSQYQSKYKSVIYYRDFKEWFNKRGVVLDIEPECEYFTNKNMFFAILFELLENARSNSLDRNYDNVIVNVSKKFIKISNKGLPPKNPDNIFNLGYTEKREGRGFGLYISKRILNELGYDLIYKYHKTKELNRVIIKAK